VQHARVCICTQLGDDEWNALSHESGNEGDVAREAVELRDDDRALARLAGREGSSELRATLQGVGSLAGLDLRELPFHLVVFHLGEPGDGGALGFDAQS
jgi:hypothetical protein